MLIELRKLPPIQSTELEQRLPTVRLSGRLNKRSISNASNSKKKPRNLIKEIAQTNTNASVEDEVTNPISRLLRIQQARKLKDPIYSVIEERGQQRRKIFLIEVTVNGEKAQGIGPNKKAAKRIAAENIMIKLGYSKVPKAHLELPNSKGDNNSGGSSGRQIAPGLLLVKDTKCEFLNKNICLESICQKI